MRISDPLQSACLMLCASIPCFGQSLPQISVDTVEATVISEKVKWDSDDPAIWIHPTDRSRSLIIGTDKNSDGAIYAFDLNGKIVARVGDLQRPNNIDIAYGFKMANQRVDIAVVTEREAQRLRIFSLPDLTPIDNGNLIVFNGNTKRAPMGIALYTRPGDNALFAFVSGKSGPSNGYIAQYRIQSDQEGNITMNLARMFGKYSGEQEIESIAVDDELGFVYYSDESVGVRKYHADPDADNADRELALFATEGFANDREGISIYKLDDGTGYILVSDQQANRFWIYSREGSADDIHNHRLLKIIQASTSESDGSEVTSVSLPPLYPSGLFVAMSEGKTFHYFSWDDIAGQDLRKRNSQ